MLKATINVGSIGKTATSPNQTTLPGKAAGSYQLQYNEDSSVDYAIIQLGANIIDQFDFDGYCTRILFDDGSAPAKEFRGEENLPYINRIMHALVKVKVRNGSSTIKDTSVEVLLQCPELWNPHDYNTNDLNQSAGIVGPAKFRIYAESGVPRTGVNKTIQLWGYIRANTGNGTNHTQANVSESPGYESMYGFKFAPPEQRTITQANTELDFTINRDFTATGQTRFREPTILFQPSSVDKSPAVTQANFGQIALTSGFFAGSAFKSDVGSPDISTTQVPVEGAGYIGFYLGAVPEEWCDSGANNASVHTNSIVSLQQLRWRIFITICSIRMLAVRGDLRRQISNAGRRSRLLGECDIIRRR